MPYLYEKYVMQLEEELTWFIDILKRENVRSYLEIGSAFGGSLWRVARELPPGSRIVAVELPLKAVKKKGLVSLQACEKALKDLGYDVHVFNGDSTHLQTVTTVRKLGPFDACFIDGGHTMDCVKQDWNNYGPMSRIVAFHDISWVGPRPPKADCDVPRFWNSIKDKYRNEEIRLNAKNLGIGVLWR